MTVSSVGELIGITLVAQERVPIYDSPYDTEPAFHISKGGAVGEVFSWVGPNEDTGGNVMLQFGDFARYSITRPYYAAYKKGRFDWDIEGVTYRERQAAATAQSEAENSVLGMLGLGGVSTSTDSILNLLKSVFWGIIAILGIVLLIILLPRILPKR